MAANRPRTAADVRNVREVILEGRADYRYWQEQLAPAGLIPYRDGDRVVMLISVTDLRWMGRRFRELSILVALCQSDGCGAPDGYYLIHAYNTSRLFALAERLFFRTPYNHAAIDLQHRHPAHFALRDGEQTLLGGTMAAGDIATASAQDDYWAGPVYLPDASGQPSRSHFFVILSGPTAVYPFSHGDSFTFAAQTSVPAVRALSDCRFAPSAWRLRAAARHLKTATVRA